MLEWIYLLQNRIYFVLFEDIFLLSENIIPIVLIKHIFVILNIVNEKSLLRLVFKRKMLIGK